MSDKTTFFTTVTATGEAATDYESVSFTITNVSIGKDTAQARGKSDEILNNAMELIRGLNAKHGAGIDIPGLKATYQPGPHTRYDNDSRSNVPDGYQVTGMIVFTSNKVEKATIIMDVLSKGCGDTCGVSAPRFLAAETRDARRAAYEAAVGRAREDFELQCLALGLDPGDFEVIGLPTLENYSRGGTRGLESVAMAASAPKAAPAEIRAGKAEISVTVNLAFGRKSSGKTARASSGNGRGKTPARSSAAV